MTLVRASGVLLASGGLIATMYAQNGCGVVGGSNGCPDSDSPHCTGPTTYRTCAGGEGTFYWTDTSCPAEQHCEPTSAINPTPACRGQSAGAACKTSYGCSASLCINDICTNATAEDTAQCLAGPQVTIPDDGTEIVIDVPLYSPPSVSQKLTENCAFSYGQPVAEGFVRLITTHDETRAQLVPEADPNDFPNGIQYTNETCDQLYPYNVGCNMADGNRQAYQTTLHCTHEQPVLYYTNSISAGVHSLRLHIRSIGTGDNAASCVLDGGN